MDVIHPRCAGVDVSKRDAKVCVRVAGAGRAKAASTVTTWGSVTNQVLALREYLIAERVTLVVMEATSDYWKPFYYLLEDAPFETMLVNARHVKNGGLDTHPHHADPRPGPRDPTPRETPRRRRDQAVVGRVRYLWCVG